MVCVSTSRVHILAIIIIRSFIVGSLVCNSLIGGGGKQPHSALGKTKRLFPHPTCEYSHYSCYVFQGGCNNQIMHIISTTLYLSFFCKDSHVFHQESKMNPETTVTLGGSNRCKKNLNCQVSTDDWIAKKSHKAQNALKVQHPKWFGRKFNAKWCSHETFWPLVLSCHHPTIICAPAVSVLPSMA